MRRNRLVLIVIIGLVAISAGFAIRNSSWARERALKRMDVEELALAAHDWPNDALTFIYFGDALIKAERYEQGVQAFGHAVKLSPKNARARLGLAASLFRSQRLKDASEAFKEAIKLDPKLPDAYLGLAQVYYLAGSPKRAIEPMKKLTELQPKNAVAWFTLGQMYGDARMSDLALEAAKKAVELDPNKSNYWRSLARLNQHYSRLDEAEEQYKKCLKLDQNDAVAYLWLGQLYMQRGDTPALRGKAESSLMRAVSRVPDMAEGYFALGQLYERKELWNIAELNFQKAHDTNPADDQALYHLGLCKVKQGKAAEGNKLIAAAQELGTVSREIKTLENRSIAEPTNRDLRLRLARLYQKYGNDEGAVQRYKEYAQMGPVDPAVDREMKAYRARLQSQAESRGSGAKSQDHQNQAGAPGPSPTR